MGIEEDVPLAPSSIPFSRSKSLTPKSSQGFTLIELVVVVTLVVVLIGTLLNRVWFYQEQAEKTAMVQVAATLQNALVMQYGSLMTHGQESKVSELVLDNPMNWLSKKPHNYAGEFYDPTPRSVAPGNWVFDLKSRELIYVVDRGEHFVPGKDGNKWVRYHVRAAYEQIPANQGKKEKVLTGILFEPVEPYEWFGRVD